MGYHSNWLNQERVSNYPKLIFAVFIAITFARVLAFNSLTDSEGGPFGYDFIAFWTASHFGLTGHPADAYNLSLLFQGEQIAAAGTTKLFPWYYPPSFYLIILPLALLPYIASYLTFIGLTLSAYVLALRKVIQGSTALWCLAAFPGLWINIYCGQNAFLTASLAGLGMLCMKNKPALAGVFIGLLVIKPHLGVLFPVALLAIGAWRTLIAAAITASTLLGIGTATLGIPTLKASLGSLQIAGRCLESGLLPWPKMPTVFAFSRLLGAPVVWSYILHGITAVCAVIIVWRIWRRCPDWNIRAAALMTATFFVSPYIFDYDLAWLAFPIAWMAVNGLNRGWLHWEREVLLATWLLPMIMAPIYIALHVQIGPWILGGLLLAIIRRANSISEEIDIHSTRSSVSQGQLNRSLDMH